MEWGARGTARWTPSSRDRETGRGEIAPRLLRDAQPPLSLSPRALRSSTLPRHAACESSSSNRSSSRSRRRSSRGRAHARLLPKRVSPPEVSAGRALRVQLLRKLSRAGGRSARPAGLATPVRTEGRARAARATGNVTGTWASRRTHRRALPLPRPPRPPLRQRQQLHEQRQRLRQW